MTKDPRQLWKIEKRRDIFKDMSTEYLNMDLLRFTTAGSVDDGKSTLIGRLLYDSKSIFKDQMEAIETVSAKKGEERVNLALLTDGLRAEREQGITIDVAYRYFATPKRKFIIADTPGHIQYTRNMVTGASTANLALILVDARKGIVEQTKRHSFIASLLGIPHIIYCINKMDLVNYKEDKFIEIKKELANFSSKLTTTDINFIPVSALKGDNVVEKSNSMYWFKGQTLLEHLEKLDTKDIYNRGRVRFPVQYVIRPKTEEYHDFRGYAGKVYGGEIKVGDEVIVLPSETKSIVKEIYFYDKKFETAARRSSCTITLEDNVNVSRGDMIVKVDELPKVQKEFTATISWMDAKQLVSGSKYVLQHGVNKVLAKVSVINNKINPDYSGVETGVTGLQMNDIASVSFQLNKPIFFDAFKEHRTNGAFILIDPQSNSTVGVGFIE